MSKGADNSQNLSWLLEGCVLQVRASNDWLERRILPLSADQLRWRPRSGCWSIAATLDHLNRTFSYYLPEIEEALEEPRDMKNREVQLRSAECEEMLVRRMEPPVSEPMSAPAPVMPGLAVDPDKVVEQFPLLRIRFANIVRSISDVDAGVSIPESIHPPVRSLRCVIGLLVAHERRHLWQVEQILRASEFQAAFARPSLNDREREEK
jgi:hypothetical protein